MSMLNQKELSKINSGINFPLFFKPVNEGNSRRRVIALDENNLLVVGIISKKIRFSRKAQQNDWVRIYGFNKQRYEVVSPETFGDLVGLAKLLLEYGSVPIDEFVLLM